MGDFEKFLLFSFLFFPSKPDEYRCSVLNLSLTTPTPIAKCAHARSERERERWRDGARACAHVSDTAKQLAPVRAHN